MNSHPAKNELLSQASSQTSKPKKDFKQTTSLPDLKIAPTEAPPGYPMLDILPSELPPPYTVSDTEPVPKKASPEEKESVSENLPSSISQNAKRQSRFGFLTQNKKRQGLSPQQLVADELGVKADYINEKGVFLRRLNCTIDAIQKQLSHLHNTEYTQISLLTPQNLEKVTELTLESGRTQSEFELHGLTNLKKLTLKYQHNFISHYSNFPKAGILHNTPNLEQLHIERIDIKNFLFELENLKMLKNLSLKMTLSHPLIDYKKLSHLEEVSLIKLGLEQIPQEILSYSHLSCLNLKENKIKEAYINLQQQPLLAELNLSSNELEKFTARTGKSTRLKWLSLRKNKLKEIDVDFINLQELRFIDLNQNKLTQFPNNILCIDNLEKLNLSNNLITTLPHRTQNTSLTELNLYDNRLGKLEPYPFANLPNLESLNIGKNGFWKLPSNLIENLRNLKHLSLELNVIQIISNDVFPPPSNEFRELEINIKQSRDIIIEELAYLFLLRSNTDLMINFKVIEHS